MTVAAVLLAAGAGSRFEQDGHKLKALLRDEPVFVHALRSVALAGFNQVVVVTGAVDLAELIDEVAQETGKTIDVVHNEHWADGQATSLAAAVDVMADSGHSAIVVGLGDQPDVGIAAWRVVGATHGVIVVATFDGKRRPPVKLDRSVWSQLPTTGDDGARVLMQQHPELVSEVPCPGDPFDVDTVEDLERHSG